MTQLEVLSVVLSAIAALLTVLAMLFRPLFKNFRVALNSWASFMRDWNGEEGEPGRDPAAGVMHRLNKIDGEFKRNGGSTMKDDVAGMKDDIGVIKKGLDRIELSLASLSTTEATSEARITTLENLAHKRAAAKPALKLASK